MNDQSDVAGYMEPGGKNATLIYILYLVSIIVGITSIVGVILAYLNKGKAAEWVDTHYVYQIRTFWIGFLFSIIGVVLMFVFIGVFVLIATLGLGHHPLHQGPAACRARRAGPQSPDLDVLSTGHRVSKPVDCGDALCSGTGHRRNTAWDRMSLFAKPLCPKRTLCPLGQSLPSHDLG